MKKQIDKERKFYIAAAIAFGVAVFNAVVLSALGSNPIAQSWFASGTTAAVGFVTAWLCWRAGQAQTATHRVRSWYLLGSAALAWACMEILRFGLAAFGTASEGSAAIDALPLIPASICLGALFSLHASSTTWRARLRTLLDGVILAVVLTLVVWVLYVQPHQQASTSEVSWAAVAHLFGDVLIAATGISLIVSRTVRRELSKPVAHILSAAVFLFLAADVSISVGMFNGWYEHGSWLDAGVSAALLCVALASLHPRQNAEPEEDTRYPSWFEVLPTFVAGIVLLCMFPPIANSRVFNSITIALCAGLFAAVLVRQLFAVLEEQRLSRLLADLMDKRSRQFDQKERQFEALVQHSSDVIVVVGSDGQITYVSPSVRQLFGMDAQEMVGQNVDVLVANKDQARVQALFAMSNRRTGVTMTAEWLATRNDGEERQVEVLLRNLSGEQAIGGTVLNIRDVTDRKDLQQQLTHQALHDHLTGLPNRALLQGRIESALTRWLFHGEVFSLLVIDLDDFKSINDSFGHLSGDIVLQTLADRLRNTTRHGDTLVRLGGNEFALLLPGAAAEDVEAQSLAERVIHAVRAPIEVEGRILTMRASAGLACVSNQVGQPDDLLRNADLALHVAKANKRGSWVQFEASMHESVIRRTEMVADLRNALENDELQLYYQPTIDLPTGQFEGVEALLRWPHAERGFISPVEFIPVAEESGLIVPIGTWVLRQACFQMAKWQARYPTKSPMLLNVNLSGRQLAEPDVVETVRKVLEESGLMPNTLVLEMTESVLMDDEPATLAKMEALCALGVELAIDDFGTGYSSLSYLRQFPISVLKIDRAFVNGLGEGGDDGDTALVQAIVDLASTLRLRTVAEGIETPAQLAALRTMGCDVGQGFLLAKPAPAEEVRRLIEKTVGLDSPLPTALPTDVQPVG